MILVVGRARFRLWISHKRTFRLPPKSYIKRGFTGESFALPLTSLQTIATQRVRWFARLAILNIAPQPAEKTLMTNEMLS